MIFHFEGIALFVLILSGVVLLYNICISLFMIFNHYYRVFLKNRTTVKQGVWEERIINGTFIVDKKIGYFDRKHILFPLIFNYLRYYKGDYGYYLEGLLIKYDMEEKLVKNLKSRKKWKRMYSVQHLGLLKSETSLTELLKLLISTSDYEEKIILSKALIKISGNKYLNTIVEKVANEQNYSTMLDLVKEIDDIFDKLIKYLNDRSNKVYTSFAVIALAEKQDLRVFDYIIEFLKCDDEYFILLALKALSYLKELAEESFSSELIRFIKHPSIEIRRAVIVALSYQNDVRSLQALADMLGDEDWYTRFLAAENLLRFPNEEGLEVLYLKAQTGNNVVKDISWQIIQKYELIR